jgi:hypothetical protein
VTLEARKTTETASESAPDTRERERPHEEEDWILCLDCGARITRPGAAIEVNGRHMHEFMNPEGIRFVVRCFSIAPGVRGVGERSTVWTWFPGHAWQIELCRGCAGHLGWSFHGATTFYGLVRDRLKDG